MEKLVIGELVETTYDSDLEEMVSVKKPFEISPLDVRSTKSKEDCSTFRRLGAEPQDGAYSDEDEELCPECGDELVETCLCCNETICSKCAEDRNLLDFSKDFPPGDIRSSKQFYFCDFCGSTYRIDNEELFGNDFYSGIESRHGLPRNIVMNEFVHLQSRHFKKDDQLKRIQIVIDALELKIEELRDDYRYILNLP